MKESENIIISRDIWAFAMGIIATINLDLQNDLNKKVMELNK